MTVSLADLPKGHEFAETRFELTSEWVAKYRAAVEDETTARSSAPALSLAALSVGALLEQATLPDGAIHVSQEVDFSAAPNVGDFVAAKARIASRGERAGWVLMGVELSVSGESGAPLISGRATITFPAGGEPTR